VPYATEPTVKLPQWTLAWQWKTSFFSYCWSSKEDQNNWYVNSRDGVAIQGKSEINEYEKQMTECNWRTFADFVNCAFGIWKISINHTNWKQSTCTCPIYFKQYICKHIIGICACLKLAIIPPTAKTVPLGQKRKVGRPGKLPGALARLPQFIALQDQDVSDEDDDVANILDPNGRMQATDPENEPTDQEMMALDNDNLDNTLTDQFDFLDQFSFRYDNPTGDDANSNSLPSNTSGYNSDFHHMSSIENSQSSIQLQSRPEINFESTTVTFNPTEPLNFANIFPNSFTQLPLLIVATPSTSPSIIPSSPPQEQEQAAQAQTQECLPKRRGRKPLSAEQKADNKAKRDLEKKQNPPPAKKSKN
jgi:hypothetical protein